MDGVQEVVTTSMNVDLTKPYTANEMDRAIKEMVPLKAPSPNRMSPLFYQTYWSDIGMDTT